MKPPVVATGDHACEAENEGKRTRDGVDRVDGLHDLCGACGYKKVKAHKY